MCFLSKLQTIKTKTDVIAAFKALTNQAQQIIVSGLGGFLSGFATGGAQAGTEAYNNKKAEKTIESAIKKSMLDIIGKTVIIIKEI